MLHIKEPIFCIKALEDGTIGVIDQVSTYRKIDPNTLAIVGGFKSKLQHTQKIFNLVSVSSSGKYTLLAVPKRGKAALYLTEEKKLIDTIGSHQGEIEAVAFSDNEQYAATGGTDGKSYVYYASSGTLLFALPPHRDYVSTIAFSPNSHYVATGSFDQTILVKNIASMTNHFRLIGHSSVIKKMIFLTNDQLLSADRDGNLLIWGINSKGIKKRLPKMLDEITDIAVTQDRKFLFAATKKGQIALYNLEEGKQLSAKYIQDIAPINALAMQNGLLCYGNDVGDLQTYSLVDEEVQLKSCIADSNFPKAYAMVVQNPLLLYTEAFIDLEHQWHTIYNEARQALIDGKKKEAEWILLPFSKVLMKQTEIKHLLEDYVEFGKFQLYIREEKYSLAYGLASKYPSYKESDEYEKLEELWESALSSAKRMIIEDKGEERARKYLSPFRSVPSKSKMINELFEQRKVYTLFRKKLAQRDFEIIFKLAKSYPFLTGYKEFKDMLMWGDHVFIKINQLLDAFDYIEASKLAQRIKDFPDFKNDIASLTQEPQAYVALDQALKADNKEQVYSLLEDYPFLTELSVTIEFESHWNSIEKKALALASEGDVEGVLEILRGYLEIRYKNVLIATVLKGALIINIKAYMKKDSANFPKLEKLIELFVYYFGADQIVRELVDDYCFRTGAVLDCSAMVHRDDEKIDFERFEKAYRRWKLSL